VRRRLTRLGIPAVLSALVLAAAGCGGDDGDDGGGGGGEGVSGSVSVMGIWSGPEQESFEAVAQKFMDDNPDVKVTYTSAGDNTPTQLSTAIEGGNPPDMAAVGQPGLVKDLAGKNALTPLDYMEDMVEENLGESAVTLGSVDGTLYGFLFKAANKSTAWYNVHAFEDAGVEAPTTWEELTEAAATLKASGIPAYSFGGADGWPLTDLFENIYLRQAGPEKYDQLAAHEIPWTDESVKTAMTTMAELFEDKSNIAGNPLQVSFDESVAQVFADDPKAAMTIEGDFVPGVTEHSLEAGTDYDVFDFPSIDGSETMVVGGGDTIISFNDDEATKAFMEFLTTSEAAEVWAERGGFASLNKDLDTDIYADDITRKTAGAIGEAEAFRFDLSDLQPSAFGGTAGQGMWKLFQDLVANPSNVDSIATQLEEAATDAYS
jgi:alpha-glucoside transport system substrate-binding protein